MPNIVKKFIKKNPKLVKGAKIAAVVTGGVAATVATGGIAGVAIAGAAAVAGTAAAGVATTAAVISTAASAGVGTITYLETKKEIDKITVEENHSLIKLQKEVPYSYRSRTETYVNQNDDQQTAIQMSGTLV